MPPNRNIASMLQRLRNYFRPQAKRRLPTVPDGTRYYVIGDIHGRLDLYDALIAAIEDDDASSGPADTRVVLLGDLIDRGPDSAGVISRTQAWQQQRNVRVLMGNHEEMFLAAFEKLEALRHFVKHGGRETIVSFGLSSRQYAALSIERLFERLPALVPQKIRDYIAEFELMIIAGDYVFVHAGIDPDRPLDDQKRSDLLWIRDRFLNHQSPLQKVVVHGHTIFEHVMVCGNRIGIDTGAFRSGVLTALVLEGNNWRVLQACASNGGPVDIFHDERARLSREP